MVFEQISELKWLKNKPLIVFGLAILYSALGVISAIAIFPKNADVMTIAFVSILILPLLNQMIETEARTVFRKQKLSLSMLFKQHIGIFNTYLSFFFGIFMLFFITAVVLPPDITSQFFSSQLNIYGGVGFATKTSLSFNQIAMNNIKVVLVTFILSLVYGAGSVIILSWNAYVWGIMTGFLLREGLAVAHHNMLLFAALALLPILPSLLTESAGYLLAAISGGVLSKATLQERLMSKRFNYILTDALMILTVAIILIFVGACIEVRLFG